MQEYAVYLLHLLPHLIQPPVRKGRKRVSTKETADAFVRVVPVSFFRSSKMDINMNVAKQQLADKFVTRK